MYLCEVVVHPGSRIVQFCAVPRAAAHTMLGAGPRIVVVFTTPSETIRCLKMARSLVAAPDVITFVVCPVTPNPAGWLRLARFLQFARCIPSRVGDSKVNSGRLLLWPC